MGGRTGWCERVPERQVAVLPRGHSAPAEGRGSGNVLRGQTPPPPPLQALSILLFSNRFLGHACFPSESRKCVFQISVEQTAPPSSPTSCPCLVAQRRRRLRAAGGSFPVGSGPLPPNAAVRRSISGCQQLHFPLGSLQRVPAPGAISWGSFGACWSPSSPPCRQRSGARLSTCARGALPPRLCERAGVCRSHALLIQAFCTKKKKIPLRF